MTADEIESRARQEASNQTVAAIGQATHEMAYLRAKISLLEAEIVRLTPTSPEDVEKLHLLRQAGDP